MQRLAASAAGILQAGAADEAILGAGICPNRIGRGACLPALGTKLKRWAKRSCLPSGNGFQIIYRHLKRLRKGAQRPTIQRLRLAAFNFAKALLMDTGLCCKG